MIELDNVTKYYQTRHGRQYVFRDISFKIPSQKNIGIIGRNGAGKSTLMRLLGGIDIPDRGRIVSNARLSWPVGLSGGFQGSLTGRQNAKFVCRIFGLDNVEIKEKLDFIEQFTDIGEYFDLPVKTYSSGMRARLGFGMSLAFEFDYYLVDEAMSVGDANFRKKAFDALRKKIDIGNVILVTHSMTQVRAICDCVLLLLKDSQPVMFDNVEEGIKAYNQA